MSRVFFLVWALTVVLGDFGSRPQSLRVRGLEVSALGVKIQVLDIDKGWRQNQRVHVGI